LGEHIVNLPTRNNVGNPSTRNSGTKTVVGLFSIINFQPFVSQTVCGHIPGNNFYYVLCAISTTSTVQTILWLAEFESIVRVLREFRYEYGVTTAEEH
jgi:hypothetical protein